MVNDFNMLNGFREANDIEWELVKKKTKEEVKDLRYMYCPFLR